MTSGPTLLYPLKDAYVTFEMQDDFRAGTFVCREAQIRGLISHSTLLFPPCKVNLGYIKMQDDFEINAIV